MRDDSVYGDLLEGNPTSLLPLSPRCRSQPVRHGHIHQIQNGPPFIKSYGVHALTSQCSPNRRTTASIAVASVVRSPCQDGADLRFCIPQVDAWPSVFFHYIRKAEQRHYLDPGPSHSQENKSAPQAPQLCPVKQASATAAPRMEACALRARRTSKSQKKLLRAIEAFMPMPVSLYIQSFHISDETARGLKRFSTLSFSQTHISPHNEISVDPFCQYCSH